MKPYLAPTLCLWEKHCVVLTLLFQTLALVGYIVEEAILTDGEGETHSRQNALDKMESRLPLLLQCTNGGQEMAAVAKYLVDIMSAKIGLVFLCV
jgi:hypothetical protein